jgi:DNA-binding MarR family transcriptional regulator
VHLFSARVLLFHQGIARRVGLNATEFKCLRLVGAEQAVTVSELAKESGLTMPAITVIVGRLEEMGFVERERDPNDRRKIALRANAAAKRRVDTLCAHNIQPRSRSCSTGTARRDRGDTGLSEESVRADAARDRAR